MMNESMNKQKNYCSEEIKPWFALYLRGFSPLKLNTHSELFL